MLDCCNTTAGSHPCWGCKGGAAVYGYLWIKANGGLDSEADYPYTSGKDDKVHPCNAAKSKTQVAKIATAVSLPRPAPEATLMEAIAKGPVAISVSVSGGFRGITPSSNWQRSALRFHHNRDPSWLTQDTLCTCAGYKTGVLKAPGCTDFKIDHGVSLVGYDTSPAAQALANSTGYWCGPFSLCPRLKCVGWNPQQISLMVKLLKRFSCAGFCATAGPQAGAKRATCASPCLARKARSSNFAAWHARAPTRRWQRQRRRRQSPFRIAGALR